MNTIIRTAVLADVDALHTLGKDVDEFSVNDSTITFWPPQTLAAAVVADDVLMYVAENEGSLVGFIIASYSQGLAKATIENVYVHPSHRGQHIGDALLKELLAMLKERNCDYVATLVPQDAMEAVSLYEKAGFSSGETFLWLDKSLTESFVTNKADSKISN